MRQLQYFLLLSIAALMTSDTPPLVPHLHVACIDLYLHRRAHRQRRRVEVRQHSDAATRVDYWEVHRSQVEAFLDQRQQVCAFAEHRRPDRLVPAGNYPLLVFPRPGRQQQIQLLEVLHLRHRHQIVAAELAHFSFHATLLVSLARITKLRREAPVRAESNEPRRLLSLMAAQDLLTALVRLSYLSTLKTPPKYANANSCASRNAC